MEEIFEEPDAPQKDDRFTEKIARVWREHERWSNIWPTIG